MKTAQIIFVLKQAEDGTPIVEICRKAGIEARSRRVHGRLRPAY